MEDTKMNDGDIANYIHAATGQNSPNDADKANLKDKSYKNTLYQDAMPRLIQLRTQFNDLALDRNVQKSAADIRYGREQIIARLVGEDNLDKPETMQKIVSLLSTATGTPDTIAAKLASAKNLGKQITEL